MYMLPGRAAKSQLHSHWLFVSS